MSILTATSTRTRAINLRLELRYALLAAGEATWIYVVILTLGAPLGFPRLISPAGIFFVYWVGLLSGRLLPRSRYSWRALQLASIAIAALAILIAIRADLYVETPLSDTAWLGTYLSRTLSFFNRFTAEQFSTLALLFAFVRGLGFANRPLTLWFVGFQFRLGIVVFFGTAILAVLVGGVEFRQWIFVYFLISLLAIALARIDESGSEIPLGGKWAVVLLSAILTTLFLGLIATRLFNLQTADAFFQLLSPLAIILEIVVALIAIPLTIVLEALIRLLSPLFAALRDAFNHLAPQLGTPANQPPPLVNDAFDRFGALLPYLKVLGVILVVFALAWLVARALNRRMHVEEEEAFIREADSAGATNAIEASAPRTTHRGARREPDAENVRRIYAALLALAQELGLPRRDAETPFEFLPRLSARFPGAAPELTTLTDAYVAVHYEQRSVSRAQVRELREVWQRLRKEMLVEAKQK